MSLSEEAVVSTLYREHRQLAAYAWSLLRDNHLVEDVLQEIAMVAVRKRLEIADEQHLRGWLRVACRRMSLDAIRRRGRRPTLLGEGVLDLLDSEWAEREQLDSASGLTALEACLNELTDYARQLMQLRYADGLTSGQIAVRLGRKPASMRVVLCRIHKSLGECVRRRLAIAGAE